MAPPRVQPSPRKDDLKDDAAADDGDFFQFPPLTLSITIVILLVFYWFVCYDIDAIPLHVLGPFGRFVSYLASNHLKALRISFRFVLIIHILEAGFAYRTSRRMMFSRGTSFKWMVQTAVLGFPSLGILLRHRKDRELKNKKKTS